MNKYEVRKFKAVNNDTIDNYNKRLQKADITICNGLKEVTQFCGGKLPRVGCDYAGTDGEYEYIAIKC